VKDVLRINRIECRLGETQVIDCVQQVGLTLPVQADKTVKFVSKRQVCLADILEVDDMQFVHGHSLIYD
jgi:hypothetical protein